MKYCIYKIFLNLFVLGMFVFFSSAINAQQKFKQGGILNIACTPKQKAVKNFNPFTSKALDSTSDYIYEPLFIYNIMHGGEPIPRLAIKFEYSKNMRSISYYLRKGVKWSDGSEFNADDVIFTYNLLKKYDQLDINTLWQNLKSVVKINLYEVKFNLKEINSTIDWRISAQGIVPEHIWKKVKDPINFTNPNPVGSGPFTEVKDFTSQSYKQCRNPHYWEKEKPFIDCLQFMEYQGNEELQAALVKGEIDWAGIFIPFIEENYVKKNPMNHHYWFPPTDNISLYLNTIKKPFNDLKFRRALSMAIDRNSLVEIAMYGYASVSSHPTGLGELYSNWYDDKVNKSAGLLGTYAPHESQRILDEAGYKDKDADGFREQPDGSPLKIEIMVVKGWTDWETAVQMIVEHFKELGINAVKSSPDFNIWLENLQTGNYDMAISWGNVSVSPWNYYRLLLSSSLMKEKADGISWSRWSSKEANQLIEAYVKTTDPVKHREIIGRLQSIVAENVPIIPLFSNPSWYEYNNSRFIGWASADNPFVRPMCFHGTSERLIHVLNLQKRPQ